MTLSNFRIVVYPGMLGLVVLFSGCVTTKQEVITWNRDSNKTIVYFQQSVVQPNDINYTLRELDRGLLFFQNGDYLHSDSRFANATRIMDEIAGGKGQVSAVVWDERTKTFKGEPYERATAYFFRGLCHFNQSDYSGALAAFRSSLAADSETRNKERKYLEDFAISHFMAALCYERLGEHENAKASLEMAKNGSPNNPFLSPASLSRNFVVILGVGFGPFKTGARSFSTGPCPEQKIEVIIDTESKDASEATNLLVQAQSQKWGEADTARIARRAGKTLLNVLVQGATGVDVHLDDDYADVRSWQGLPLDFYLFTADVPPGNHNITVKCYDQAGKEIEHDRQVWFDVPVLATNDQVLYLPVRQYWQNHYGLKEVKINPSEEKEGK